SARPGGRAVEEANRTTGRTRPDRAGRKIGYLQTLPGNEPPPAGEARHRISEARRRGGVARLQRVLRALGVQLRPDVAAALAGRRPRMAVVRAVAEAVSVVTVPARSARRRALERGVDHG